MQEEEEEEEEEAKALSIGSVEGGWSPNMSRWREAISNLSQRVRAKRSSISSPLNVNVVFHVPGDLVQPNFEGVRTGSFSRKRALLMVQVALPETTPRDFDAELRNWLESAIAEAEEWARKKRVAAELSELRTLVRQL